MAVMSKEAKRKTTQEAKEEAILAGTILPLHEREAGTERMVQATHEATTDQLEEAAKKGSQLAASELRSRGVTPPPPPPKHEVTPPVVVPEPVTVPKRGEAGWEPKPKKPKFEPEAVARARFFKERPELAPPPLIRKKDIRLTPAERIRQAQFEKQEKQLIDRAKTAENMGIALKKIGDIKLPAVETPAFVTKVHEAVAELPGMKQILAVAEPARERVKDFIRRITPLAVETVKQSKQYEKDAAAFNTKWEAVAEADKQMNLDYHGDKNALDRQRENIGFKIREANNLAEIVDSFNGEVEAFNKKWSGFTEGIPEDKYPQYVKESEALDQRIGEIDHNLEVINKVSTAVDKFNENARAFQEKWRKPIELSAEREKQHGKELVALNRQYVNLQESILSDQEKLITPDKPMETTLGLELSRLQTGAELLVPGVYTGTHWAVMTKGERAVSITTDVAAVLLFYGLGKVIGAGARHLSRVSRIETPVLKAAKKAGEANKKLQEATKLYNQAQRAPLVSRSRKLLIKHANKVEKLRVEARTADQRFINRFLSLEKITKSELKRIEKRAGFKKLTRDIKDIMKAQRNIKKAWDKVDKAPFNAQAQTPKAIRANNKHLRALEKLQKRQAALDKALDKAGSKLQPRYTPKPPPDEFAGYQMKFKERPKITGGDDTISSIESFLARGREVSTKGDEFWILPKDTKVTAPTKVLPKVKVETKPRIEPKPEPKGKFDLEVKPKFKKPSAKPKEKLKAKDVPKIEPGVKPIPKPVVRPQIKEKPISRPVPQIEVKYLEAILIEEATRPAERAAIQTRVRSAAATAIKAAEAALVKGATAEQVKDKVEPLVKEELALKPQVAVKPKVDQRIKTLVEEAIKVNVKKVPALKFKMRLALLPGGGSDKDKRQLIRASNGAITWRHGELRGKDVWHVFVHPYKSKADFVTVVGKKPRNATVVKGPGSAYQTIKLLYGKAPAKKVTGDIGFFDFSIEPIGMKKVGIGFTPDPKLQTTGDITIGRKTPPITERTW